MDELVMISDPETYEMVYMNQAAQKAYHVDGPREYKEKKCYELLEGQKAPCAYCPLSILRQDRFHTATHHSVKSGLDLLVRDTLVLAGAGAPLLHGPEPEGICGYGHCPERSDLPGSRRQ